MQGVVINRAVINKMSLECSIALHLQVQGLAVLYSLLKCFNFFLTVGIKNFK